MKKNIFFLILFIIILTSFIFTFGLYEVKFLKSRASIKLTSFSQENSYIFITPLQARANGQEKIRLTVFILNDQGLGILGKKIYINRNEALNIEEIQSLTDNFGKAYFDISSNKPGDYYLEIKVDGETLNQKAHLVFN
jgi:hypothetical protein